MADLLEFLKIHPKAARDGVFNHLKYEDGPHALRQVPRKALIACTSRTGSSLLQVALERYNLRIQEYFNPEGPPKRAYESGRVLSIRDYADFLAETAVSDDFFVAKGAINSILYLYYLREVPEFSAEWKIVFLRRRNVVRQAISMQIAELSGQWTHVMSAKRAILPDEYSFVGLNRYLQAILVQNDKWERAFAYLCLEPYRLFYEDMIADLDASVQDVATFLGVDVHKFPCAGQHMPWLRSQSTELNTDWEQRFEKDLRSCLGLRVAPGDYAVSGKPSNLAPP
jgi:hypothetical protein